MLQITDDLKTLDKVVADAKPEEILETLKDYADKLWQNRGNLSIWNSVSLDIAETVWPLQEKIELMHVVLFHFKYKDKIKEIYKLITAQEPGDVLYSMFYSQLSDSVFRAGNMKYGQQQMVGNGRVLDFSDYANNLISLKYVLACGPRDFMVYHIHDGAVARLVEQIRKPLTSEGDKPPSSQT